MSALPDPWRALSKEIGKLREQVRRQGNASPFFGTGISPTGNGGMESDDFDGDLDAGNAGTTGWAFNSARVAIGELLLRPGSIGNDSLTNPVLPGALSDESTGFGITTTSATKLLGTIAVPSGFTSAAIFATARTFALDKSTTSPTDYLYSHLTLGGISAAEVPLAVSYNGGSGTSISPLAVVLTSLGSSIAYSVSAHAGFDNWGSDALNRANVSGLILWFR
jgi:hypothetical protein